METTKQGSNERVLVLSRGEEVDSIRSVLSQAGISVVLCADLDSLCRAAQQGVAILLLTEEIIDAPGSLDALARCLRRHPECSQIPVLAVVRGGEAPDRLGTLDNVVLLSEPVPHVTLVSAVRSALLQWRRRLRDAEELAEARQRIEALEEEAIRFRRIFDRAAIGIALVAAEGKILLANAELGEMLGHLSDDLQGRTLAEITHPEDAARSEALYRELLHGGLDCYTLEKRLLRSDGTPVWVELTCSAVSGPGGEARYIVAVVEDITDVRSAREALRLGEERLRLATEAAGIGIWQWNIAQDRFTWDERCTTLLGSPPLEVDSGLDDFLELLHPEDRSRLRGRLPRALERPEINTEFRTTWPDGSVHWLLVRGRTSFDAQGKPIRMNGILMDVTAAKTAEEFLQRAKEAAETASRTKSEFLANISHEIRTPMTVAMGAHDLLQDTKLEEEQRQYVEMAQVALSTLLRLIDEILDYSRLESGKMLFEVEPFDLHSALQEVVGGFNLEAGRKGLELHLEIDDDVPRIIRGDHNRLRQVLTNLIGNAVKFTAQGSVRVRADVSRKEQQEERLLFSVHDTGIGISPEKQHLLFQSFSQLDASHTRRYGGTGIGLALSRSIVERLGGEIWMESEPGKGSVFYFTIPLQRPAWAWAQAARESELPERGAAAETGGASPRILMVEDDPMLRELLGIILGNRHWRVKEAENGRQALATWEREKFDLILMDVQMPEMDGLEATRTIRRKEKETSGHVPIIAMTAHVREEDRRNCLEAGMDDYLSKPVQMSELYAKLDKYLGTGDEASGTRH